MLTDHHHQAAVFDPGHCRACAVNAGLLDHYRRVQAEEDSRHQTEQNAERARKTARRCQWLAAGAGLLAAIDLLTHL